MYSTRGSIRSDARSTVHGGAYHEPACHGAPCTVQRAMELFVTVHRARSTVHALQIATIDGAHQGNSTVDRARCTVHRASSAARTREILKKKTKHLLFF